MTTPFDRLAAWFRDVDPRLLDALIGTIFTVGGLVNFYTTSRAEVDYRDADALGTILVLACSLPFYVRRRAPLATTLVTTTALVLLGVLRYPANTESQMLLVSAYTIGSHTSGRKRVAGFAWIALGIAVVAAVGLPDGSTADILLAGAFYTAMFFFGSAMRNRRLYLDQVEERAAILEREHDEAAKRAVADERLRIAQELHDVVAHSMGVIAVQAGVGAHVIDTDVAEAKRSLEAISATSRSTLTEIRRLLGVLRTDGDAHYEPAPGLVDLDRLAADLGSAGLTVQMQIEGADHALPPGVELTAYRIVQEALTNVLKHAGPATAMVTIVIEPDTVRIEVLDDGRGINGRATAGGHGLVGMRERVSVYGGTLETGPRVGGGYRVVARLPYGGSA